MPLARGVKGADFNARGCGTWIVDVPLILQYVHPSYLYSQAICS
jgi:hypothetical protein